MRADDINDAGPSEHEIYQSAALSTKRGQYRLRLFGGQYTNDVNLPALHIMLLEIPVEFGTPGLNFLNNGRIAIVFPLSHLEPCHH